MRVTHVCPCCFWRAMPANAKNGICASCRTDKAMFPVNHAGRQRRRGTPVEPETYAYV